MMKRIRIYIAALLVGVAVLGAAAAPVARAIDLFPACDKKDKTAVCEAAKNDDALGIVGTITNLLMWALGIVSVIMIVIGGFKYVTSNGDANAIQSAKNTILYSVIGLAVAILGQVIIQFVAKQF